MNKKLIIGLFITLCLIVIAVAGPWLTPYSNEYTLKPEYIPSKNGGTFIAPPMPPNAEHWLGIDKWGYDIGTLILYGAKYTIFTSIAIAFARVVIGGAAGMYLGHRMKKPMGTLNFNVLNGIPVFIITFFVMYGISMNSLLPPWKLIIIQSVVFVLIGLPGVVSVVQNKTSEINKKLYVEAAVSLGASKERVIRKHIFPHLKESLLVLFVNEIIMALTIFGQLGLFHLFLGGTKVTYDPIEYMTITQEWAGKIADARYFINVNQYIFLFPLLAYILLIVGLYLVSRGLEVRYQQKYSKFPQI